MFNVLFGFQAMNSRKSCLRIPNSFIPVHKYPKLLLPKTFILRIINLDYQSSEKNDKTPISQRTVTSKMTRKTREIYIDWYKVDTLSRLLEHKIFRYVNGFQTAKLIIPVDLGLFYWFGKKSFFSSILNYMLVWTPPPKYDIDQLWK